MLRAEQATLLQSANIQLLAIRQLELTYLTQCFGYLGLQQAFILGFAIQAVTQVF